MLVIGRKRNERFRLRMPDGTIVWITVLATMDHKCRLGIDGPLICEVMREEKLPHNERETKTTRGVPS